MNTQQLTPNCKDIAEINKNQGIPHGWKQVRFKDCIEIANGQVDPKVEPYCNMKHVGLENIEKFTGRLLFAKLAKDENLTSGKYLFNEGDVLYGKIRPELSKVYLAEFEGICSADIYPLKPKKDIIAKFLKYILLDHRFFRYAVSVSARTGLPKINRDDLGGFKIHVPPIREQQKITDILSTWDKAIELKEKLIEQKKEQKKGLMQRLLMRQVRLPGHKGEWKQVFLGNICRIRTGKKDANAMVEHGKYKFFTCADEDFNIDSFSFDTEALIISGNGNIGKIKYYKGKFDAYQRTYVLDNFTEDIHFIKHYLSLFFSQRVQKETQKGAMPYIKLSTLSDYLIELPDLNEQKAISNLLNVFDYEINLLEKELEALKQQKKGLMQLLLTGKVRVKC